jgi:GNAT superfamily N-acetyltransferase
VLAHALDREDPAMLRLLLDHGPPAADPWPERDRCLRWAVYRGRSPEVLRLLVEHGADPDAREGADSAYGLAVAYGRPDLAEALVGLGATPHATAMDELLGACARGDGAEIERRATPDLVQRLRTELAELLVSAAADGRAEQVRALLRLGVPVDTRGQMGGRALHHAAWWGRPDIVAILLEHGADVLAEAGPEAPGTALAWAAHGSHAAPGGPRRHVDVARLLIAAGDRPYGALLERSSPELAEWLRERMLEAPAPAPAGEAAEAAWAAQAALLRALARSPLAETRAVGDGVAVKTRTDSNAENGVVCSRIPPAEIERVVRWMADVPAQWLCSAGTSPPDLVHRLVRLGGCPERSAVIAGGRREALDLRPAPGCEIADVRDAAGLDAWYAVSEAVDGFVGDPERHRAVHAPLLGGPPHHLLAVRDGRAIGLAGWLATGDALAIVHLAVVAAERRSGVGRALVHAAAQRAPWARLVVASATPSSVPFWERLGLRLERWPLDRSLYLPLGA